MAHFSRRPPRRRVAAVVVATTALAAGLALRAIARRRRPVAIPRNPLLASVFASSPKGRGGADDDDDDLSLLACGDAATALRLLLSATPEERLAWHCAGAAPSAWRVDRNVTTRDRSCAAFAPLAPSAPRVLVAELSDGGLGNVMEFVATTWLLAIAARRRFAVTFAAEASSGLARLVETFPELAPLARSPIDDCVAPECADLRFDKMRNSRAERVLATAAPTAVVAMTSHLLDSRETFAAFGSRAPLFFDAACVQTPRGCPNHHEKNKKRASSHNARRADRCALRTLFAPVDAASPVGRAIDAALGDTHVPEALATTTSIVPEGFDNNESGGERGRRRRRRRVGLHVRVGDCYDASARNFSRFCVAGSPDPNLDDQRAPESFSWPAFFACVRDTSRRLLFGAAAASENTGIDFVVASDWHRLPDLARATLEVGGFAPPLSADDEQAPSEHASDDVMGDRVVTLEHVGRLGQTERHYEAHADEVDAMYVRSLADLVLLSRTDLVWASTSSTFGIAAGIMSGLPWASYDLRRVLGSSSDHSGGPRKCRVDLLGP